MDILSAHYEEGCPKDWSYNRQGQSTTKTDQNSSAHTFSYDKLARQTAVAITTLGSGVDAAVRWIGQPYKVCRMVENMGIVTVPGIVRIRWVARKDRSHHAPP